MTRVHVFFVPVQPPVQPLNTEFASGVALSFTVLPMAKLSSHEPPQDMLPVLLVVATVPVPEPSFRIASPCLTLPMNLPIDEGCPSTFTVLITLLVDASIALMP